ncbi:serine hydrolase domain-containing protein [Propionibacteriaceae bacterium Y1700]|uniref:serine hydrolase domain-containing protein n=1 Tax=Microlunatus sp. Y1700 TaxID=3418487 RepID=UPI003DA7756E
MAPDSLAKQLDDLATAHDVPGAAVGLLRLGDRPETDELITAAYGVTNVETGVPVTPDTVFQIGSISKVFTTMLIMQLVDQGVVDLDTPVATVMPELQLSTETGMQEVTVRQLLCHTSGIDGDVFTDFGRGDDCVERYVAALDEVPQVFRPGRMFSYSNTAFVLAGRLIEVLTGTSWDAQLRSTVLTPLGLTHTSTLPEEALLLRSAVGHEGEKGARRRVDHWQLPRSVGPAGLINSTVADVLTFAACHLRDGLHGDTRLLSADASRQMRARQSEPPVGMHLDGHQGLGWRCDSWHGVDVFGHDGATVGQYAHLLVLPEQRLALSLLTNGPGAASLWVELRHAVLADEGVEAPLSICPAPTPGPGADQDLDRWVGIYRSAAEDIVVERADDGLRLTITETEVGPDPDSEPDVRLLRPLGADRFASRDEGAVAWSAASFGTMTAEEGEEGRDYLHLGLRLYRRAYSRAQ